MRGRDSSVGIATRYGMDGPGIESRWKHQSRPALGAHPASYTMDTGSFPGVRVRWAGHVARMEGGRGGHKVLVGKRK